MPSFKRILIRFIFILLNNTIPPLFISFLIFPKWGPKRKGEESKPVSINPTGSNLPQDGKIYGAYWLNLPVDAKAKGTVKEGYLREKTLYAARNSHWVLT